MNNEDIIEGIKTHAVRLKSDDDLDILIDAIGEAKYVLLGEATHGTSEFYKIRAELSKRLIERKGFSFVAVEGDWPSCYALNQYIKGNNKDNQDLSTIMRNEFKRWPSWMWSNTEVQSFIEWIKQHNDSKSKKIGFYGIDMYSLYESMEEIIRYLESIGSDEIETAKKAFSCFQPFEKNEQDYAYSAGYLSESCEEEVLRLLMDIQSDKGYFDKNDEASLSLELNALVAANAELYYRSMIRGGTETWNIRDTHMVETLKRLIEFHGPDTKVIVWEHNTHVGDARATDMSLEGMVNVGQLMREHYGLEDVFVVGFGTYEGTVIAGSSWGATLEKMVVPPASKDSWEDLIHRAGPFDQLLLPELLNDEAFQTVLGHRAIGVVYDPALEQFGNYVPTNMAKRYDSFIFVHSSNALHPL
jgi:erythromycin esterase